MMISLWWYPYSVFANLLLPSIRSSLQFPIIAIRFENNLINA